MIKVDRSEAKQILETMFKRLQKFDNYDKKFRELFDPAGDDFLESIYRLAEGYIRYATESIVTGEDALETIYWHIYDNDYGNNKLFAQPNDFYEMKPICNVDDLLWLIYAE